MVAGHSTVLGPYSGEGVNALTPEVIGEAALKAVQGDPKAKAFTTYLLFNTYDYVLRRIKLFMGDPVETGAGTIGCPIMQPPYVKFIMNKLTWTLASQLRARFDGPYSRDWRIARGLTQYLWVFSEYRDDVETEVPEPGGAPGAQSWGTGPIIISRALRQCA